MESYDLNVSQNFSEDLPGTSYEEGGFKRVREVYGELATAIRNRCGATSETPVIMTEMRFFGGMFEPESEDECDLIITCGECYQSFGDVHPDRNFAHLIKWIQEA